MLLGLTVARSRTLLLRVVAYTTAAVFFVLQISNAHNSYAYMKEASESAKTITTQALRRNDQGHNILIVSVDAIFYSYFYESYLAMAGRKTKGTAVTLTPGGDTLKLLKDLDFEAVDDMYFEGRWIGPGNETIPFTGLEVHPSIPKPQALIWFDGRMVSLTITDRRDGSFCGVLKTILSDKNIVYQTLSLPKGISLRLGLSKGMDTAYVYYCTSGRCSDPIIMKGDGE
jgi:hypothetical protein